MKIEKILALIMGAIIASSIASQTAVQIYAIYEDSNYSDEPSSSDFFAYTPFKKVPNSNYSNPKNKDNTAQSNLFICKNNLLFKFTKENEVQLVRYDGKETNVIIPQSITIEDNTYTVTSIGERAFALHHNLVYVELPESITEISSCAFFLCQKLLLTKLPDSVTNIGKQAFYYCKSLQLKELPNSIEEIDKSAFKNCINLSLNRLPAKLTKINEDAFMNCENLQLTELPANLSRISSGAFYGTNIENLTIPASVTVLGKNAFKTNSLKQITVEVGNHLSKNNIERACGQKICAVKRTDIVPPQMHHYKIINRLGGLE